MADRRVVLVTGASGGLGRALARAFAADNVVGQSRSAERGDVAGDLGSDADVDRIVREIVAEHGRIDVLINNAADQMIGESGPHDAGRWAAMLDATLLSAVRLSQSSVPHMPEGAAIVNVSSVESSLAFPGRGAYAAAKAGLEALTRSLAVDLAPRGIRVNAVAPGLIDSEGLRAAWPEGYGAWTQQTPRGTIVSADEVAAAVHFLAGSAASGISGVVLPVDAGWSASARLG